MCLKNKNQIRKSKLKNQYRKSKLRHNIGRFFNFFSQSGSYRSSHGRCSVKKGVPRNFAKFIWKHLCQSLFLNKVAGIWPATLFKKRLWHRCFHVNFVKFLRTLFLQNTSGGCSSFHITTEFNLIRFCRRFDIKKY